MISNARYGEPENITISATIDGLQVSNIRVDAVTARDGEYAALIADWIAAGGVVTSYVSSAP